MSNLCFNFRSVFIVLISFLLNFGKEMFLLGLLGLYTRTLSVSSLESVEVKIIMTGS